MGNSSMSEYKDLIPFEGSTKKTMAVIDIFLGFFKVVTIIYDIVTLPIYGLTQQSWKDRTKQSLGTVSNVEYNEKVVNFKREKGSSKMYQEIIVEGKVDTVTKAFDFAVNKYKDRECVGTREVLGEEDEVQSSGKVFKKL